MKTQSTNPTRRIKRMFTTLVVMLFSLITISLQSQTIVVDQPATKIINKGNGYCNDMINVLTSETPVNNRFTFIKKFMGADYYSWSGFISKDEDTPITYAASNNSTLVTINGDSTSSLFIDWLHTARSSASSEIYYAYTVNLLELTVTMTIAPGGGYNLGDPIPVFYNYDVFASGQTRHEANQEDPVHSNNQFFLNGNDELGIGFNFNDPPGLSGWNRRMKNGTLTVIVGTSFNISLSSLICDTLSDPGRGGYNKDKATGWFQGNIQFSVFPIIPPTPIAGRTEFSLDIGSDTEISDPFADGDEVFDPGDAYILKGPALLPGGQNGIKDDKNIFLNDPSPVPGDPASAAPCGNGLPVNPMDYFDLDGMDNLQVSLTALNYGPGASSIAPFPDDLIYVADHFMVSYDDDESGSYTENTYGYGSVPVNSFSPMMYETHGKTNEADEVIAVDFNSLILPSPYFSLDSLYSEHDVHISMSPNPDSDEKDDDDVDALDYYRDQNIQGILYFSPDHEATYYDPMTGTVLMGGSVYESNSTGIVEVVNCNTHLGLPDGTDIDAFEFGWVWDQNEGRYGLALLFSVDNDDWLTPNTDESGGLDPAMIYYSFLNGSYAHFSSTPLDDDVDAITICDHTFNGFAGGIPPSAGFKSSAATAFEGDNIFYTDLSSGNPTQWDWTFNGGTPSAFSGQTPPLIQYTAAGFYTTSLTVSNAYGSSTTTEDILVLPANWRFTATQVIHSIVFPASVVPEINGIPVLPGTPAGVFFTGLNGDGQCGGFIIWNGTTDYVLSAFGDDLSTPYVKEGFSSGESLSWKIFDMNTNNVFPMQANYDITFPDHDGKFVSGGLSCLVTLENNMATICQTLSIPQGWSGISTYVEPANPAIVNMFAPVVSDLIILTNLYGMYWPVNGINTLGNWDVNSGYVVKMQNDVSLQVCGTLPASNTITVNPGWSIIPVLKSAGISTAALLGSLPGLVVAKEIAGSRIYWPSAGYVTLTSLEPGKAYYLYASSGGTLNYGVKGGVLGGSENTAPIVSPWNEVAITAGSHLLAISGENGAFIEGEIIGAFTNSGYCAGYCRYEGQMVVLTVFADDPTSTEVDGMSEDEEMIFRVYNPITKAERNLSPEFDTSLPDHDGNFRVNGISGFSFKTSSIECEESLTFSVYPNPAADFVNITITKGSLVNAEVMIYDFTGRIVMSTVLEDQPCTRINSTHLSHGVYQLILHSGDNNYAKKFVVR